MKLTILLTMKKIFSFSAIILISFTVLAQKPITYTEVVQVDSVSQDDLYNRARLWFTTTYNSANDVLQMDSREDGQIIGKAVMAYSSAIFMSSGTTKGNIRYTVKIFVKDGRYKYEITNFIHEPYGSSAGYKTDFGLITTAEKCPTPTKGAVKWSNKVWKEMKDVIAADMESLIPRLKQGMVTVADSEDDNW